MAEADTPSMEELRRRSHQDLRRRTIAHMQARTTDLSDGPRRIDPAIYVDPRRFEDEKREIFRKRPVCVALSGDVPNPGDKIVVDVLGPSILIVRCKDGGVRAYLNMCPHRAAQLVTECDSRQRMTCRFHGWTFNLEGELIGLPGKEGFAGIDKSELGLVPVPVAEWHGMIFVRATAHGEAIDVPAWLGPMADELAHLELADARPVKSSVIKASANWKYAFDTYGESYHFATLHPSTIGALAFSNTMTHQSFGRNFRIGFPRADFIENVVRTEDYSVSAEGQRNLAYAPEGFRMIFGANEAVLQKQHAEIERILAQGNEG